VAHLRGDLADPDLALLWVAPTSSVTAPFLPWWIGTRSVPPEYGPHRYLTQDAGETFLNPAFREREASASANRLFSRLMYLACGEPGRDLPRVTRTLNDLEARLRAEIAEVERVAALALAEDRALGRGVLTRHSHARATEAMHIGAGLVAGLDAERRARSPSPSLPPGGVNDGEATVNCLIGGDPDVPAP
jgi:hypothetical protein